jgi:hypothetical protein
LEREGETEKEKEVGRRVVKDYILRVEGCGRKFFLI